MTRWSVDNIQSEAGFAPSLVTTDGAVVSSAKRLLKNDERDVAIGVWRAPPGVYNHGGSPTGETFVIIEGTASIDIAGLATRDLEPGSFVTIGPKMPSTMTVHTMLHKVSLNFG